MTEAELINKLKKADENAASGLVELYGDRLFRAAYLITEDMQVAEEVVQDTFLKVCRKADSFKGDSSLQTWIFRIMVNTAKNRLRAGWVRRVILWDTSAENLVPAPSDGNPEDSVLRLEKKNEVMDCLKQLSQKYREVLVLYYIEELKVDEISRVLEEPTGTVKSKLSRGREKLKELMEKRQVLSGGL